MSSQYNCPTCGSLIPLEDINVSNDIALCRKCGKTSPFSQINNVVELANASAGKPPRGVRIESDLMSGGVTITYKRISKSVLFLIPFTLFWSGISMGGIYGTQIVKKEFDLTMSLFGLPFLIGTIVLVCSILIGLFGKHAISLRRGEGTYFFGIGKLGRTRRFTYSRDARVSLQATNFTVNNQQSDAIVVEDRGNTFKMCAMIPDDPKPFIAGTLQREIARGS